MTGITAGLQQRVQDAELARSRAALDRQEREATARHEKLLEKLAPFEQLARQKFPGLDTDAALKKFGEELGQVRELATRDIAKSASPTLRDEVLTRLRGTIAAGEAATSVVIDRRGIDQTARRQFFDELADIIRAAGIEYRPGMEGGTVGTYGTSAPYRIQYAPGAEQAARALARALEPLITTSPSFSESRGLLAKDVRIIVGGQIDFRADGSVVIR